MRAAATITHIVYDAMYFFHVFIILLYVRCLMLDRLYTHFFYHSKHVL
jgi:hypothetical protein